MGFLRNLNIAEILKFGSIGLALLLAYMSYWLIGKEQAKKKASKSGIRTVKIFMLFSLAIVILGIISEFVKTKSSLNIRLGNNEISINELTYSSLSSLDTKEYFINSDFGFAFKKPNKSWTNVKSERGIDGLLNILQTKNKADLDTALSMDPLGSLFKNVSLYYFENAESKATLSLTDSTGNDLMKSIEEKSKMLLDANSYLHYDTTKVEGKKAYLDDMAEYRDARSVLDSLVVREGFVLSIYPKGVLPDCLKKMKLPGFYTSYSSFFDVNVDKLVANEKQILVAMEMTLNNVKLKSRITNFQNKKWLMFTENEKYYFVVEITYSPQISSTIDLWDDLQDVFNSFTILVDK